MNLDRALHVYRHVLWDLHYEFHVWLFRCDYCDDEMEFATQTDALGHANMHSRRHETLRCVGCGNTPYINDFVRHEPQ